MVAVGVFGIVSAAVFAGVVSMQRCFTASAEFSAAKREQTRITDFMAMDLRRALTVTEGDGATTLVTITMPDFYDAAGKARTPTLVYVVPADIQKPVQIIPTYGAMDKPMQVVYTRDGSSIYRQETGGPKQLIATNVSDFKFDLTEAAQVVETSITFTPQFRHNSAPNDVTRKGTTVDSLVKVRNVRRDLPL